MEAVEYLGRPADGGDPVVDLTDILGPEEHRYFGSSYRDVAYTVVRHPVIGESATVGATFEVVYPPNWSTRLDGSVRVPHLSTLDAVVLGLRTLADLFGYDGILQGSAIRSLRLRAGSSPWEDLDSVPVSLALEAPKSCGSTSARILVGNIKILCELAPGVASTRRTPEVSRIEEHDSYRHGRTRSFVSEYDPGLRQLKSEHWSTMAVTRDIAGVKLSLVEVLAISGQLAQAVILAANGITHDDLGNLWMRSVELEFEDHWPILPTSWGLTTRLLRDRRYESREGGVHDVLVECTSTSGVRIMAKLAYVDGQH